MTRPLRFAAARLAFVPAVAALFATACHSPPPAVQVRPEPPPASEPAPTPVPPPAATALPAIGTEPSITEARVPRVAMLTVVNEDIAAVVRELAARFGLQYQVDSDVRGTVNATLRDKTLAEALATILPSGVTYTIREGLLRVSVARVATRIFTLDFVALSRIGTASTVIQRRFAGSGGDREGADVVTAVSVADVWDEIRIAVEALVFDAPRAGPDVQGSSAGVADARGAGRSHSRTSPDGRRVIVNPIAGTITVTALPDRLEQVNSLVSAFAASVQRQVLIEAKIVEVVLSDSSRDGIDWSAVTRSAGLGSQGSPAGRGVQFTLPAGSENVTAVLRALATQGEPIVLSSPRFAALNNQRAVFDMTTGEIVFNLLRTPVVGSDGKTRYVSQVSPSQVDVGVILDVLPQVSADNSVVMNIRPSVRTVARTERFTTSDGSSFETPVIDTRESDTVARLRAGETIIIAGLMHVRHATVRSGVRPFRTERDVAQLTELVIFLTPTIIAGQPLATR